MFPKLSEPLGQLLKHDIFPLSVSKRTTSSELQGTSQMLRPLNTPPQKAEFPKLSKLLGQSLYAVMFPFSVSTRTMSPELYGNSHKSRPSDTAL